MGLFSFVKEAGEKLWATVTGTAQAAEPSAEDKAAALRTHLQNVGVGGAGLDVQVNGDVVVLTGTVDTQEAKEKILLTAGNVAGVGSVEDHITVSTPAPEARFYTVVRGDTLSGIAKAQYGNANAYMKIFEANKPMLSHPDKIYPGQVLRIPE